MKTDYPVLVLTILAIVAGCNKNDNLSSPQFSIESEINAARPYHFVFDHSAGNWTFEKGGISPNNPFHDAHAEHGFLVVAGSAGKKYFNLSLAKDAEIEPSSTGSSLTLRY